MKCIRELKGALGIPVIANGGSLDIESYKDVEIFQVSDYRVFLALVCHQNDRRGVNSYLIAM
jgi:hypothetical protein